MEKSSEELIKYYKGLSEGDRQTLLKLGSNYSKIQADLQSKGLY